MTTAIDHIRADAEFPLPDGVWTVDPQRSEIGFAVRDMWGLRTVRGCFGAYDGRLTVRGGDATGELRIEAGSLDTGQSRRDRHLRSPAFFAVERHPRIVFTATALTARASGPTVEGELVIGSSCVELEIPLEVEPLTDGARRLAGGTAVSRQAAGVDWNMLGMIRGDAVLHAELTLERAPTNGGNDERP
jgi:polyisoprenoid-binding protein YceI